MLPQLYQTLSNLGSKTKFVPLELSHRRFSSPAGSPVMQISNSFNRIEPQGIYLVQTNHFSPTLGFILNDIELVVLVIFLEEKMSGFLWVSRKINVLSRCETDWNSSKNIFPSDSILTFLKPSHKAVFIFFSLYSTKAIKINLLKFSSWWAPLSNQIPCYACTL